MLNAQEQWLDDKEFPSFNGYCGIGLIEGEAQLAV